MKRHIPSNIHFVNNMKLIMKFINVQAMVGVATMGVITTDVYYEL